VLVVPASGAAGVADDAGLRPYRNDVDVIVRGAGEATGLRSNAPRPAVLVRPDGHVAARGRAGSMDAVTGYLRNLFSEPAGVPGPVRS
jgi:hypothetical protein